MKTAWMKNRNADSVRSFAYRKGKYMKSRILYPTKAEHTFFTSLHGTVTKIYHSLDHKVHLIAFKTIGTIQKNNGIKLELNKK